MVHRGRCPGAAYSLSDCYRHDRHERGYVGSELGRCGVLFRAGGDSFHAHFALRSAGSRNYDCREMKNLMKNDDGTFTVVLHLQEAERKQLKKLARSLDLNDFETIKYAIQLVSWWSKNKIEPEEEE